MHGRDRFDLHEQNSTTISVPANFGPRERHSIRADPRESLNSIDPALRLHMRPKFSTHGLVEETHQKKKGRK